MKPVIEDATVLVLDDPSINGQAILAIGKNGAVFLASPNGGQAIFVKLPELRAYFEIHKHVMGEETARIGLAAINKFEREAS
jgi:hypothetical protein